MVHSKTVHDTSADTSIEEGQGLVKSCENLFYFLRSNMKPLTRQQIKDVSDALVYMRAVASLNSLIYKLTPDQFAEQRSRLEHAALLYHKAMMDIDTLVEFSTYKVPFADGVTNDTTHD